MNFFQSIVQRRSFVSRFSGGAAALMATIGGAVPPQSAISSRWQPERHKDDWLDRVPSKHRFVFDSTMPEGFGYALLYASNYFVANRDGYGKRVQGIEREPGEQLTSRTRGNLGCESGAGARLLVCERVNPCRVRETHAWIIPARLWSA